MKRIALCLLTFVPPFILAGLNPDIFVTALGIAGGFGEAYLNGLLPIALIWIGKHVKGLQSDLRILGNRAFLSFLKGKPCWNL